MPQGRSPLHASGLVPQVAIGSSIPKVIYQTFPTHTPPPEIRKNIELIKLLNPDWEHKLFDDEEIVDFIKESYPPNVLESYNMINKKYGAARADLFRYLLMYKNGGFYLDIKGRPTRPLSEVILPSDKYLLSHWKNEKGQAFEHWGKHRALKSIPGGEYQQWFIFSVPGHPLLKAVIERVLRNIRRYNPIFHGVGKYAVVRITGPVAYTLAISPLLPSNSCRLLDSEDDLGLEYSIYQKVERKCHEEIFTYHYSTLREPLIEFSGMKRIFNLLLKQ